MNKLLQEALRETTDPLRRSGVDWEVHASEMTREELFSTFCEWHGLLGWARTLAEVWEECKILGRQG